MLVNNNLIIYFSRADENYAVGNIEKGNTEILAEYIKELTNADIFKVEPLIPYAKDYNTCIKEAQDRQKTHEAPIKETLFNITNYDTIYIGAPVYWGYLPEEMVTALKDLNFDGKIIKPFVTHEGSGLANIPNQLEEICVNAIIKEGFEVKGSLVLSSKQDLEKWVNE